MFDREPNSYSLPLTFQNPVKSNSGPSKPKEMYQKVNLRVPSDKRDEMYLMKHLGADTRLDPAILAKLCNGSYNFVMHGFKAEELFEDETNVLRLSRDYDAGRMASERKFKPAEEDSNQSELSEATFYGPYEQPKNENQKELCILFSEKSPSPTVLWHERLKAGSEDSMVKTDKEYYTQLTFERDTENRTRIVHDGIPSEESELQIEEFNKTMTDILAGNTVPEGSENFAAIVRAADALLKTPREELADGVWPQAVKDWRAHCKP